MPPKYSIDKNLCDTANLKRDSFLDLKWIFFVSKKPLKACEKDICTDNRRMESGDSRGSFSRSYMLPK